MRTTLFYTALAASSGLLAAALPVEYGNEIQTHSEQPEIAPRDATLQVRAPGDDKPLPNRPGGTGPGSVHTASSDSASQKSQQWTKVQGHVISGGNAPAKAKDIVPSARNGEGSNRVKQVQNALKKLSPSGRKKDKPKSGGSSKQLAPSSVPSRQGTSGGSSKTPIFDKFNTNTK